MIVPRLPQFGLSYTHIVVVVISLIKQSLSRVSYPALADLLSKVTDAYNFWAGSDKLLC